MEPLDLKFRAIHGVGGEDGGGGVRWLAGASPVCTEEHFYVGFKSAWSCRGCTCRRDGLQHHLLCCDVPPPGLQCVRVQV